MAVDTVGVQVVAPDGRTFESRAFADAYQAAEWLLEQCSEAELRHLQLIALPKIAAGVKAKPAKAA